MKFVYHLGAHCTDEDRLLSCLFKNKGKLSARGVNLSGPGRYRPQLRELLRELRGEPATVEQQNQLMADMGVIEGAERIIFSHSAFLGGAGAAASFGRIYPKAGEVARGFARMFPEHEAEFFLAIRDPASFIPAIFNHIGQGDFGEYVSAIKPTELTWSDTIARIRTAAPNVPLTVWCNEDTPILWTDILNAIAGIEPTETLRGAYEFPASLLTTEGRSQLISHVKTSPPKTAYVRRRTLQVFLEKHGDERALDEAIDLPGWSQELIDALSAQYDADLQRIARFDGVRLLTP